MHRLLTATILSIASLGAVHAAPYTVQRGDTLSVIALKALGDSDQWQQICDLNKDVLGAGCNLIVPGMVLSLPPAAPLEKVVTGGRDLDETWYLGRLNLHRDGTISSEESLLKSGVYDPQARVWLVRPAEYTPVNGASSIRFTTGPNTTSVRIYPLRSPNNLKYAFTVFDGLKPNTTYEAVWKVQTSPAYSVSDVAIFGE